jgi:hypothetical protein
MKRHAALLALCAAGVAFGAPRRACATPHVLPHSYGYATLPSGGLELEQYVDVTPVPAVVNATSGGTGMYPLTVLTTEIEYGLDDHLEAGLYYHAMTDTGAQTGSVPLRFQGLGQRLRYRFAEPGALPVDLSVYGEVSELDTELELEGKINLEKRIGALTLLANLVGEREIYYGGQDEWVVNPTAGGSWEFTPAVHLGVEYWFHAEYGGTINANNISGAFNPSPHSYIGPAVALEGKQLWVAFAPYLRLDHWNRAAQFGDQYGRIWWRFILGISP